jgi:hypothetical protein
MGHTMVLSLVFIASVAAVPYWHSQFEGKTSKKLVTVSKTLPLMGTSVGLMEMLLELTTSTANGRAKTLNPSKSSSRECKPVFWKEGDKQPTEKLEMITAATEKKLKLHMGLTSMGDTDATVIMMPPSI